MKRLSTYIDQPVHAAPLAVFRILFGVMMLISIARFWALGWIDKLYIQPDFFFSYYGFEWVKPLGIYTYGLFAICGLAALCVAIGFKYRWAIVTFFLSFTYIELMDKTTYLNHYYFISVIGFVLIFLPAAAYFSVDARKGSFEYVPRWATLSVKLLLGTVYFYAGLAKLNSDWLIHAMPLKIWLPTRTDLPLLGSLLQEEWIIYGFSWAGAFYDLSIPFLLFWKRTRLTAFVLVIVFHVLTRILFPIGMFPFIMIVSTLIFFDDSFHQRMLKGISDIFRLPISFFNSGKEWIGHSWGSRRVVSGLLIVFILFQLAFPWRYLLYPGELFWTEEGFRFSWRVMLMEKAGNTQFKVVDEQTGHRFMVDNTDFLTPFQEKQMAFQPDFILEYAHYLADHFASQGHENVGIYAESYVALNGRKSTLFIDPTVNLAKERESFCHKTWILPFEDEIKGL